MPVLALVPVVAMPGLRYPHRPAGVIWRQGGRTSGRCRMCRVVVVAAGQAVVWRRTTRARWHSWGRGVVDLEAHLAACEHALRENKALQGQLAEAHSDLAQAETAVQQLRQQQQQQHQQNAQSTPTSDVSAMLMERNRQLLQEVNQLRGRVGAGDAAGGDSAFSGVPQQQQQQQGQGALSPEEARRLQKERSEIAEDREALLEEVNRLRGLLVWPSHMHPAVAWQGQVWCLWVRCCRGEESQGCGRALLCVLCLPSMWCASNPNFFRAGSYGVSRGGGPHAWPHRCHEGMPLSPSPGGTNRVQWVGE